MKYKFWDCGYNTLIKYNYLQQACNDSPSIIIYTFSLNDRESFNLVMKQINNSQNNSQLQNIFKIIVITKIDYLFQSQVTRSELAELSTKLNIPMYFIKNINNCSNDLIQNEKDMMKIKNDLAEYLLSQNEKRNKLFKNQSRFKVIEKNSSLPNSNNNTLVKIVNSVTNNPISKSINSSENYKNK
jgi:vacuolar-type H+-ATPase catalytic subunit A/Vma1